MKEQDDKLTLQETEQLCRLYMDCRLSVFEETELQYILTQVDYHSPLIDDVRNIMGCEPCIADKTSIKTDANRKRPFRKWTVYISIAASIAILFGLGLTFFRDISTSQNRSQSYYIAYADGHRLSDDAAKVQIETDIKSADDFFREMTELEAREKQMIDNFTTFNILEE
ncbi:MAG: hypothetical protein K2J63_02310 [Muribaculaceae bacterium]|nr:hypothetical protein [Muribaculaceae bacterium]